MKKTMIGLALLSGLLLGGCGREKEPAASSETTAASSTSQASSSTSTSSSKSSAITSETSKNSSSESSQTTESSQPASTTESSAEAIPAENQHNNLVGTWSQPETGTTLSVTADGQWQLRGKVNSSGTLKLAMDSGLTQLVKLYGFNQNIDGIGTYFTAQFNEDSSKLNYGYLGSFQRTSTIADKFSEAVYLPALTREGIDLKHSLLGTWTTANKGYDFQVQYNFDPDGSFQSYSSSKGVGDAGTYQVAYLPDDQIDLTLNYAGRQGDTARYVLSNGRLFQPEFEWAGMIRNTVPALPVD